MHACVCTRCLAQGVVQYVSGKCRHASGEMHVYFTNTRSRRLSNRGVSGNMRRQPAFSWTWPWQPASAVAAPAAPKPRAGGGSSDTSSNTRELRLLTGKFTVQVTFLTNLVCPVNLL